MSNDKKEQQKVNKQNLKNIVTLLVFINGYNNLSRYCHLHYEGQIVFKILIVGYTVFSVVVLNAN